MTKNDLIAVIAEKADIPERQVGKVINAAIETVIEVVTKGEDVCLKGFGTFKLTNRNERNVYNVHEGKTVKIAPRKAAYFRVGKAFKKAVNE